MFEYYLGGYCESIFFRNDPGAFLSTNLNKHFRRQWNSGILIVKLNMNEEGKENYFLVSI